MNRTLGLAEHKAASRREDERRMAEGEDPARIGKGNAFIPAEVARGARIKSVGKRFKPEDFGSRS